MSEAATSRRLAVVAGCLALVLSATGCQDDAGDVTLDQARSDFPPLVEQVHEALVSELGVSDAPPTSGTLAPGPEDGTCYLATQGYRYPELLGVDVPLDEVRDVVAGVLEPEGWDVGEELELPGGFVGFDAEGPGDARLELRTKSDSELHVEALVSGDCERGTLPAP